MPDRPSRPTLVRSAAALVVLRGDPTWSHLLLIRRAEHLRTHPGEIALPGGLRDSGETIADAALREAHEEIGLDLDSVRILGALPRQYVNSTATELTPVVARWIEPHDLRIQPREVSAVLEIPATDLLDTRRWRCAITPTRGPTWAWQLDNDLLWGVTACVIMSLLDAALPQWSSGWAITDLPALNPTLAGGRR